MDEVAWLKFGFVKVRHRGLKKNAHPAVCQLRAGEPVCESQKTAAGGGVAASTFAKHGANGGAKV